MSLKFEKEKRRKVKEKVKKLNEKRKMKECSLEEYSSFLKKIMLLLLHPKVFSRYLGNDVPEKFRPRREILREKLTKRPLSNLHGFDKKKFCCDLILFSKKNGHDE